MRFSPERIQEFAAALCEAVGFCNKDAEEIAKILVKNDMRGISSHGINNLLNYLNQAAKGAINTKASYKTVKDAGAIALIDAECGMGLLSGKTAMELAIEKAKLYGIGAVGVKNTSHSGALGYYASMCSEQKMLGIAMGTSNPIMTMVGGKGRMIGNNPLAFAAPSPEAPILFDIAMSIMSGGKLRVLSAQGKELPCGVMLDKNGSSTTKLEEYLQGGALIPMGNHKGFGLALMIEILCSVLSGAGIGSQNHDWVEESEYINRFGQFFIAIPADIFIPYEEFESNMAFLRKDMRQNFSECVFPGELENTAADRSKKEGIELEISLLKRLETYCKQTDSVDIFDSFLRSGNRD